MVRPYSAVLVMEEPSDSDKPLMLKDFLAEPILARMVRQLLAEGIQRFFLVCGPAFAQESRACLPGGEAIISDQRDDLMAFLNTPDPVLVVNRSAIPAAQAGPGFVYAAPGYELQEAWRVRMTNAVQEAVPVPGWLPVYGPGGYCWRPTVDDKVLVLKTGSQGESPCILGKQQQLDELQPGEVRLTGGESGILLGQDKLELTGVVRINGQTLESIITEIVLELIG